MIRWALAVLMTTLLVSFGASAAVVVVDSANTSANMPGCSGTTATHGATCTSTTVMSFSFTNTGGSLLTCGVHVGDGYATPTTGTMTVTYGGVSMGTADSTDGANAQSTGRIFHLLNPKTGANTVTITTSLAAATGTFRWAGCVSYTGNNPTTPIINASHTNHVGTATTPASLVMGTSTPTGNVVFFIGGSGATPPPAYVTPCTGCSTGGTALWDSGTLGSSTTVGNNSFAGRWAGSGITLTVGTDINPDFWDIEAVEVAADTANHFVLQSTSAGVGSPCTGTGLTVFDLGTTNTTAVSHTLAPASFSFDEKDYILAGGHPNLTSWNGTYTVRVNFTVAPNTGNSMLVALYRYNSACTFIESKSLGTNLVVLGINTWTASVTFTGPVSCTDRFAVAINLQDTTGSGDTATYEVNVDPNDIVFTPFADNNGGSCGGVGSLTTTTFGTTPLILRAKGTVQ